MSRIWHNIFLISINVNQMEHLMKPYIKLLLYTLTWFYSINVLLQYDVKLQNKYWALSSFYFIYNIVLFNTKRRFLIIKFLNFFFAFYVNNCHNTLWLYIIYCLKIILEIWVGTLSINTVVINILWAKY